MSLFNRDVGVAVGDVFVDIDIEMVGLSDPMKRVRIVEIDEVGMIHLVGVGGGARRVVVTTTKLAEKFRKE